MSKYKLEYIWLDGYEPVPNLRSKTKIVEFDGEPVLEELPGLELRRQLDQAGRGLELGLRAPAGRALPGPGPPQRPARDVRGAPARRDAPPVEQPRDDPGRPGHLVRLRAGVLPLPDGVPLGFPREGFPAPQGEYYTGVGYKNAGDVAREIVDAHIDLCLEAGINLEGINAEVAKGQWEFQIFGKGSKRAADEVWLARYLLLRLCERYRVDVNFHPKPLGIEHDWNGSGMHTNFSTRYLREIGGEEYFEALMAAFDEVKDEHIAVYGPDNHMRLTGLHETAAIDEFTFGVANRGASIRIPHSFVGNGYRGYLEDRRPNSLGDPYRIAGPDPADDRDGADRRRRRGRPDGRGGRGLARTETCPGDSPRYMSEFDTSPAAFAPAANGPCACSSGSADDQ